MADRAESSPVLDPPRVMIDGLAVDAVTEAEVVTHVMACLEAETGGVILTANADILHRVRTPAYRHLADRAAVVVADGMPLVWASRIQGDSVPERVAGADLVWSLSGAAAERGFPVYLLGAGPGIAEQAAARLIERFPALEVCGWSSPPMGFESDADEWARVETMVADAEPMLVMVALGFPKQEEVAFRLSTVLPSAWFLGCGGALDMAAGRTVRAPAWARAIGAEWLHRLWLEPRRLAARYLRDDVPYVLALLTRSVLARARRRSGAGRARPAR